MIFKSSTLIILSIYYIFDSIMIKVIFLKENKMSVNLENIASDLNCSVDDVKILLREVVLHIVSFIEITEVSIPSNGFKDIEIASTIVINEIKIFDLDYIKSSINSIVSAAKAQDIDALNSSLDSLKNAYSELNNLL